MPEKFDPSLYKKFKDLPPEQKPYFKPVKDGFIDYSALTKKEAEEYSAPYIDTISPPKEVSRYSKYEILDMIKKMGLQKNEASKERERIIENIDKERKSRIESENFSRGIEKYQKSPDVRELTKQIQEKQEGIEKETINKIQDIYSDHFAVHGTRLESIFPILEYGLMSNSYNEGHREELESQKRIVNIGRLQNSGDAYQGRNRISTFSVSPLLKTIDKIENNNYKHSIIPLFIQDNVINKDIDYNLEKFIKKIRDNTNDENIQIKRSASSHRMGDIFINIELNKPIESPFFSREDTLEAFFYTIAGIVDDTRVPITGYLLEIKKLLIEKFGKDGELGEDSKRIKHLGEKTYEEIYKKIDKKKLEHALLNLSYNNKFRGSYVNLLIDVNNVDDVNINKSLSMHFGAVKDDGKCNVYYPESVAGYKDEVPIFERIKKNAITGMVLKKSKSSDRLLWEYPENYSPIESIESIKSILKNINIEKSKEIFSSSEIKLLNDIQNHNKVNNKVLLMFASKVCNYNLLKKDLSKIDLTFATANFYKLPVYDRDGNLIWPKEINHEEVKKIVEERDKGKEE